MRSVSLTSPSWILVYDGVYPTLGSFTYNVVTSSYCAGKCNLNFSTRREIYMESNYSWS